MSTLQSCIEVSAAANLALVLVFFAPVIAVPVCILCAGSVDIFQPHFDKCSLIGDFCMGRRQIQENRESRFVRFMQKAYARTLFDRPTQNVNPLGPMHLYYETPIYHRLQMSYEDVEEEAKVIR